MRSAYFEGDAPIADNTVFYDTYNFKIYYHSEATGFTNPWYGYETAIKVTEVTLSDTSKDLIPGAGFDLIATISPADATNKEVTWTSSDETIASVDEAGQVTAHKVGEATITATTADGNQTATCIVTVRVPVDSVSLNAKEKAVLPGDTFILTATVSPEDATNQEVSWTSSNTDVASVDEAGQVTAKSAGIATITVTTDDGNKTATLTVEVDAAVSYAGNLEVSKAPSDAYGNVDGENGIDSADALEILKYSVKLTDFSEYKNPRFIKLKANVSGDVDENNDPKITSEDALEILQRSVLIIDDFKVEE